MAHVFISYTHHSEDDARLAAVLAASLKTMGHQVFIDIAMSIGVDWSDEIAHNLDSCDVFVVLLSRVSIDRDMVREEVSRAKERGVANGIPHILPVRVKYDGPLGYVLGAYLNPVQMRAWNNDTDTPLILAEIAAVSTGTLGRHNSAEHEPVAERAKTVSDPFFVVRACDSELLEHRSQTASSFLVCGARQMGKTSLLRRYLNQFQSEKAVVRISLAELLSDQIQDFPTLTNWLVRAIMHGLGFSRRKLPKFTMAFDVREFLEEEVFRLIPGRIAIAFDEVDRVCGTDFEIPFFSMFRTWADMRPESIVWSRIDLLFSVSTEPSLLGLDMRLSPFQNLAIRIDLAPLTVDECQELNSRFSEPQEPSVVVKLHRLLSGHPKLTRDTFEMLGDAVVTAKELTRHAAKPDGPFREHLGSLLHRLRRSPHLLEAMRGIARSDSLPDEDTIQRLLAAGLIRRSHKVLPASELYRRFFRSI